MMGEQRLDPLDAYERVVGSMRENPRPYSKSTTVTEEIPDVRYGQVDPQPALDALDRQLRTAKGDVAGTLSSIRKMLFQGGDTDLSVEGLLHARERIDRHLADAVEIGDRTKVRDLQIVRSSLDAQLKGVPEVAAADANFARNSRPLEAFGGNAPLGRATARDELTGRMTMPAEQVPGTLSGATATREALSEGGAATRRALQGRMVTQLLDGASDARGGISADRLRVGMRDHEDVLRQIPDAYQRLDRVASAQEARDRLRTTVVGRLAERDATTARAVDTLFPRGGDLLPNGEREVGEAVSALARRHSMVARQLVRAKAETLFNAAARDRQFGDNQLGGARFRELLVGNRQEAANFDAAVRALPDGDIIARGWDRFLDVLKATGRRMNVGSRTSYNDEFIAAAKEGGALESTGRMGAGGPVRFVARVQDRLERWRLGRNIDELARLFSDPDAVQAFRGLIQTSERGGNIVGPVSRLTAIAARSSGQPRGEVKP